MGSTIRRGAPIWPESARGTQGAFPLVMRGVLGPLVVASLVWQSVSWGAKPTTEPSARPTANSDRPMVAYGWQVFAIDGAALALETVALAVVLPQPHDKSPAVALALTGLGTYLMGPPILHAARGNWDNAGESLGLRLGLPFGGGLTGLALGALLCPRFEHPGAELDLTCLGIPLGFAALGAGLGALVAMGLDATLVARQPATPDTAWHLVPSFDPHARSVALNAVGRF